MREQQTSPEPKAVERRMPAYFYRLSAARQRTYLKSDSIERMPFVPDTGTLDSARNLMRALETGTRPAVNDATRVLVCDLCRQFAVPAVRSSTAPGAIFATSQITAAPSARRPSTARASSLRIAST